MQARNAILGMAAQDKRLAGVRPNGQEDTPQYQINIDQAQAGVLGLNLSDINSTMSLAWGGSYINDFIDRGRVKRVYVQGDGPSRMMPDDLNKMVCTQYSRRYDSILSFCQRRLELWFTTFGTLQRCCIG